MRRRRSKTHPAATQPRTDRTPERQLDSYGLRGKLPDPTVCSACGAMYRDGRWRFGAPPADAHRTRCPACRRMGRFRVVHYSIQADHVEHRGFCAAFLDSVR